MGREDRITPHEALKFNLAERVGLRIIGEKFDNWLDYHNSRHTLMVVKNAGSILATMHKVDPLAVTERDVKKGGLLAVYHDIVQNFQIISHRTGCLVFDKIERDPNNEARSASEEDNYMAVKGFPKEDREGIYQDMSCTIAVPDPLFPGTFYQPNLGPDSSFIARAVAFADLGCAGMEGPTRFREDGMAWFRELFVGVKDLLSQGGLTTEQENDLRDFMLSWLDGQVKFAKGRQKRTALEIEMLPEEMRGPIWKLFPHFESTISMTEKNHRLAQNFSLEKLTTFFGYNAQIRTLP